MIVDLFAGPGGWDTGARLAGYTGRLLGVEHDEDACATGRAAGHERLLADVAVLDPTPWVDTLAGLILSPPCQAWSKAGKRLGLLDQPRIWAHVATVGRAGHWVPYPRDGWRDPRSPLVLEVLRWVLTCRPRWFACEQVADVFPFWQELARVLRAVGYSTAAYVVSSEEFGVPQTRVRAILTGSLDITVGPPRPTHQAYRKGQLACLEEPDLFGDQRLPWVSMAQALGWDTGALVGFPRAADTGDTVEIDGESYRARDLRAADQPAQAVTEKVRSWSVRHSFGQPANPGEKGAHELDPAERPAVTVTAKVRSWEVRMHPQGLRNSNAVDWVLQVNETENGTRRHGDEPAPTVMCSRPGNLKWTTDRPATTVQGEKAIRVSVAEAGVLQSFPADYPWQGSKTSQYRQVGDAVPPVLAATILAPLLASTAIAGRGAA